MLSHCTIFQDSYSTVTFPEDAFRKFILNSNFKLVFRAETSDPKSWEMKVHKKEFVSKLAVKPATTAVRAKA